jgi:hypothetical protein
MLIETDVPGYAISLGLIAAVAVTSAAFFPEVIGMARGVAGPVVTGKRSDRVAGEIIEHADG